MVVAIWRKGDLVELDGILAVVVGTDAEEWVPEDHLALWFGEPSTVRKSQGGKGGVQPIIRTVPAEYCTPTADPAIFH